MGLVNSLEDVVDTTAEEVSQEFDLSLDDIDDRELDTYIMTEDEYQHKSGLWHKMNATYLEEQRRKEFTFIVFLW